VGGRGGCDKDKIILNQAESVGSQKILGKKKNHKEK